MNTKLTGIFTEGDTKALKDWAENMAEKSSAEKAEISDIKFEIISLRQSLERMEKKIDNIEKILEKVSE
ncbi:ubiquinone biosynthesis protein UbiJ [Methanomicrobium sp. W14]|uniref:hypothetical protein n=1 Tax=Methanomicrobium sp. W14 TaxID=2817839 RepID=UPI001AE4443C|nr:hypothetical protein [Methanomicrobium sp. W14]MBP2133287.1 ubiquinone biosynthesis protein UbiJ [Methanomicrobium sp. W14]